MKISEEFRDEDGNYEYEIALTPNPGLVVCESLKVKSGELLFEGEHTTHTMTYDMDNLKDASERESYIRDIGNISELTEFSHKIKARTIIFELPFTYGPPDNPFELYRLKNPLMLQHVFKFCLETRRLLRVRKRENGRWILLKRKSVGKLLKKFQIPEEIPVPRLRSDFGYLTDAALTQANCIGLDRHIPDEGDGNYQGYIDSKVRIVSHVIEPFQSKEYSYSIKDEIEVTIPSKYPATRLCAAIQNYTSHLYNDSTNYNTLSDRIGDTPAVYCSLTDGTKELWRVPVQLLQGPSSRIHTGKGPANNNWFTKFNGSNFYSPIDVGIVYSKMGAELHVFMKDCEYGDENSNVDSFSDSSSDEEEEINNNNYRLIGFTVSPVLFKIKDGELERDILNF